MGYKNTAGNSSISNEMGQWRYFTASMDKLGAYKGAKINLQVPEQHIPQKMNWAAAAGTAVAKGMGVYEAYREREYKSAEKYLDTHSLAEYKQQIKDKNVPFQYDYLAMSHLKQGMGENIFKLAAQDFQTDIDRNKYRGMSPEEVDAAFYAHVQDSIKEFDDGSLGFSTEDYYFNKGVYDNANKTRVGMLLEHAKVEDDFLQKQFEQQTTAKVKALANDPAMSLEEIQAGINDILNTSYRMSPDAQYNYLKTFLNELGNNPNGDTILENIGNMKVSGDVTLRQYMGEDEYQQARIKAESFRFRTDAKYRMEFQQGVDRWVRDGNVIAIQNALNKHIATNGNVEDAEYEYMLRAIDQARTVQEANTRAAAKSGLNELAMAEWEKYYRAVANGTADVTFEVKKQEIDNKYGSNSYKTNDLKVIQQMITNEAFAKFQKGDSEPLRMLMDVASAPSQAGTEYRSYLADNIQGLYRDIDRTIQESVETGAPIPDSKREEYLQQFQLLSQMYHVNSFAFTESLGENYKDTLGKFRRMDLAMRMGLDPLQQEVKIINSERAMRDEVLKKTKGASAYANYQLTMKDIEFNSGNLSQRLAYSEFLTAEVKARAVDLVMANPDANMSDAVKAAEKQVLEEFGVLEGTQIVVPKALIKRDSEFIGIDKVDTDEYMTATGKALKNILSESTKTGVVSDEDYSGTYLGQDNTGEYVFVVVDYLGRHIGDVPLKSVTKRADKLLEEEGIQNIQRLSVLQKHKSLPSQPAFFMNAPYASPDASVKALKTLNGEN